MIHVTDNFGSTTSESAYQVEGGTTGVGAVQPTFSGTPLFNASYVRSNNLIHFRINVDMSNITSFGEGQYYFTLPPGTLSEYDIYVRNGRLTHSSGDNYSISGLALAGTNVLKLYSTASNAKEVAFTHSVPVNLNTGCTFTIFGAYFAIPL